MVIATSVTDGCIITNVNKSFPLGISFSKFATSEGNKADVFVSFLLLIDDYQINVSALTHNKSKIKDLPTSDKNIIVQSEISTDTNNIFFNVNPDQINYDFVLNQVNIFLHNDQLINHWSYYSSAISPFLPNFSSLVFHSTAAYFQRYVGMFFAQDDGGKTTFSQLSNRPILSDDHNLVTREPDGRFRAYGTPWGRIVDPHLNGIVGGLFLLEKAPTFSLEPISPRTLIEFLWQEHADYYRPAPPEIRLKAFDLICELCHSAPTYRMRFPKDYVDVEAIERIVTGRKE